ncbi:unnamed protein product [Lactuca saligna]|uniref:Uncharacterized protein n=1 Tax=Lactuca saligna TaxID=75948 RepID=A0AA35ZD29_LACSI|nr:unnamed protein product [Lactuca saligna]
MATFLTKKIIVAASSASKKVKKLAQKPKTPSPSNSGNDDEQNADEEDEDQREDSPRTEDFLNIQFKGFKEANQIMNESTLADFLFMNPYDWISLFLIVMKDEQKCEPVFANLKKDAYLLHPVDCEDGCRDCFCSEEKANFEARRGPKDLHKLKVGKLERSIGV